VAAAIIGALTALLGVVLGQVITGRSEHKKWLRDQSFAACVDLLRSVDSFRNDLNSAISLGQDHPNLQQELEKDRVPKILENIDQMYLTRSRVIIVCSQRVGNTALVLTDTAIRLVSDRADEETIDELVSRFEVAFEEFVKAVRSEIRSRRRRWLRPGEKSLDHLVTETGG
jgi:hypothetical protein